MIAASALLAAEQVRTPGHFQWPVITLLLLVLHAYVEQARAGRWSVVLGGITFWLMDWVNEIVNGLLFHFSSFAPAWSTAGSSAYTVLIGLNVEISLMFAVMGLLALRMLPDDARQRWLGLPNRLVLAATASVACVLVELWLHHVGALQWAWADWNADHPWLIWLLGYLPFFVAAYAVHDLNCRRRQVSIVAALATAVALALYVFADLLAWI